MFKRILSVLIVLILTLGMLPAVFATNAGSSEVIGNVRVQALSSTLLRVELKGPKGFEDRETYHIANRDWDGVSMTRSEQNGIVRLETADYAVEVPANATALAGIKIYGADGSLVYTYTDLPASKLQLPAPGNTPNIYAIADSPRVVPAEWGYAVPPANNTENTATNGWDLNNDAPDVYFFMPQRDAKTLRTDFYKLFGPAEMVELKTLGLWQSRYVNYSDTELLDLVEKFRTEGYPLDNLVLDTNWRAGGSTGYDINTEKFPDMEGFLAQLKALGLNVIFNDHANMQSSSALDAAEVAYRNENLQKFLEMGVDSWWYDRNWSASIASPINGIAKESFGMYAYSSIQEDYYATNKEGDYAERNVLLANVDGVDHGSTNRDPDPASHRYSIQWTGDTYSNDYTLAEEVEVMVEQGAIYGNPYVTTDLGGHINAPDDDSYARWVQYGALSPVMRFHSASTSRYPWDYETVEDTTNAYVLLRYRLMPLLYQLAHENYETGLPIARRLDFNYPEYGESQSNSQYLLGNDILVAPLSTSDTRAVFIPSGTWINAFTGERVTGPKQINVTCDITTSPLFIREGAIVALASDDIESLAPDQWDALTLDLYPSETADGAFRLYEDDAETEAYKDGHYRTTDITMTAEGSKALINIAAAEGDYEGSTDRTWKLRIHADDSWGALKEITINGEAAEADALAKVAKSVALNDEGGSADGVVYELTLTAAVDEAQAIAVEFEDFAAAEEESEPTYNGTALDMAEDDIFSYFNAPASDVQINNNAAEIAVNGTEYFTFYIDAKEEDAALYLNDHSGAHINVIALESVSGAMKRAITVKISGIGSVTASVSIGDVKLEAVTRSASNAKPGATANLTLGGDATTLNLTNSKYVDWFYPSKNGVMLSDQKKGGAYLMAPETTGIFTVAKDSARTVSWSDGSRDATESGVKHSTPTTDGTAIIAVPSDQQTRCLTIHCGIYSTTTVEAFDAAGNQLGAIKYPNTKSLGMVKLVYQSEQPTTVYVKFSRTDSSGNNFGIQCYTLEEVEETAGVSLTLQDATDTLNMSDSKYDDWIHRGQGAADVINQKVGGTIIQNVGMSGHTTQSRGTDYKTAISWSDGDVNASVSNSRQFYYSTASSEAELRLPAGEWTVDFYIAAWKSAPKILVTDQNGTILATAEYETVGTASLPKVAQLKINSESSRLIKLLVTPGRRADGTSGNGSVFAVTVAGTKMPEAPVDIMTYNANEPKSSYLINDEAGWKKLIELVNGGVNTAGMTFTLMNDLDFAGESGIVPISNTSTANAFRGTLDGNGKTIKNLTISGAGMFRYVETSTYKNLTLDTVSVTWTGKYGSVFVGQLMTNAVVSIDNVDLINCTYNCSSNGEGVLVGSAENATLTVKNCELVNCVMNYNNSGAAYNGGFLVGTANTASNNTAHRLAVSDCAVIGCTMNGQNKVSNLGWVCGLTEFASMQNIVVLNNKMNMQSVGNAFTLTGFTETNGTVSLSNIYVFNSGSWEYRSSGGNFTVSNLYLDTNSAYTHTKLTDAYEMAWRMNNVSDTFAVSDGKIIADAAYPTRKVIFGDETRYTEASGLVADIPVVEGYEWVFDATVPVTEDTFVASRPVDLTGDINGDSSVDAADVVFILQYLNDQSHGIDMEKADLNGDGKVTLADALRLLKTLNA